jgi:hypothetical protein
MPIDDAEHWRLCAEEMRMVAENMKSAECRGVALRIAKDYERLAGHAERRAGQDAKTTVSGLDTLAASGASTAAVPSPSHARHRRG